MRSSFLTGLFLIVPLLLTQSCVDEQSSEEPEASVSVDVQTDRASAALSANLTDIATEPTSFRGKGETNMAARLLLNVVIGGGPVGGTFNAPVGQLQSFEASIDTTVSTCWYVPVDNLGDLLGFDTIVVAPSGHANSITLTFRPNRNALLRIYIYGE